MAYVINPVEEDRCLFVMHEGEARFVEKMTFNIGTRLAAFVEVDKAKAWIRQEETPGGI